MISVADALGLEFQCSLSQSKWGRGPLELDELSGISTVL